MTFDLSAALEALTQRMQTNPSEFFEDTYRWNFIMQAGFKESLSEDEIKLLVEGLIYVRRAEINNRILQGLLDGPESAQEYEKVRYGPVITSGQGWQGALQGSSGNAASSIFKSQLEVNQMQNIAQNIPSQYMKSFFK